MLLQDSYGRPLLYVEDEQGHLHRESGPGGGQFVSKGEEGGSPEESWTSEDEPVKPKRAKKTAKSDGKEKSERTSAASGPSPDRKIVRLASMPLLKENGVEVRESLKGSANTVQLVKLEDGTSAVFKPSRGEYQNIRKDVPGGTYYKREAGAFAVARGLGMADLVPPTTIRDDPQEGVGSIQEFVPDAAVATFTPSENAFDGDEDLARGAIFDFVIGNSDRHQGNWLVRSLPTGPKLVLIDNGLSFPVQYTDGDVGSHVNFQLFKQAEKRGLIVPVLSMDMWPAIETDLRNIGLEPVAIDETRNRFKDVVRAAGKPFSDLPKTFVWQVTQGLEGIRSQVADLNVVSPEDLKDMSEDDLLNVLAEYGIEV